MRRRGRIWGTMVALAGMLALSGLLELPSWMPVVGEGEAEAIVGRPLTPLSYAGVARRTSRRTVRRTAAATGGYPYPYYW